MNLLQFIAAGFETVFTAINYCFYVLATHPDELKKLQEEIDSNLDQENVNYENIQSLEYLDMFIKEVLRMYPVATM